MLLVLFASNSLFPITLTTKSDYNKMTFEASAVAWGAKLLPCGLALHMGAIHDPAALLQIQFPAYVSGKQEYGSSNWALARMWIIGRSPCLLVSAWLISGHCRHVGSKSVDRR